VKGIDEALSSEIGALLNDLSSLEVADEHYIAIKKQLDTAILEAQRLITKRETEANNKLIQVAQISI